MNKGFYGRYVGYDQLFKLGNTKLSKDTLIFNMTSTTSCPSKMRGLCRFVKRFSETACYAYKAELRWPEIKPFRERQERYFHSSISTYDILSHIEKIVTKYPNIRYFRFNEAGDFKDQLDIRKLNAIALMLKKKKIITYGYTSRSDLCFGGRYFIVRGSGWKGPDGETQVIDYKPAQEFRTDKIKITNSRNKKALFHVCPGTGCGNSCQVCMNRNNKNIAFHKH